MQLQDKVAFITGSASGIGKEIAIVFAKQGAKIVIADLNKEAADATAAELKATGAQAIGVAVDVTSEDQVNAAVEEAAAASQSLQEQASTLARTVSAFKLQSGSHYAAPRQSKAQPKAQPRTTAPRMAAPSRPPATAQVAHHAPAAPKAATPALGSGASDDWESF